MTALELRAALVFVAFHLSTLVILASLPASAWQWTLGSFEIQAPFNLNLNYNHFNQHHYLPLF